MENSFEREIRILLRKGYMGCFLAEKCENLKVRNEFQDKFDYTQRTTVLASKFKCATYLWFQFFTIPDSFSVRTGLHFYIVLVFLCWFSLKSRDYIFDIS